MPESAIRYRLVVCQFRDAGFLDMYVLLGGLMIHVRSISCSPLQQIVPAISATLSGNSATDSGKC